MLAYARRCGYSVHRHTIRRWYHAIGARSNTEQQQRAESFLGGNNASYIEEMYWRWQSDPASVHASWHSFFATGEYTAPPRLVPQYESPTPSSSSSAPAPSVSRQMGAHTDDHVEDYVRVTRMARAFQVRGHLLARLDPLGLSEARRRNRVVDIAAQELEPSYYGWSEADMSRRVVLRNSQLKGLLSSEHESMTIREIYDRFKDIYSGTTGLEYMHIPSVEQCNWVRERFETREKVEYTKDMKLRILDRIVWADHFERFLAKKYATAKRFGLEGCESVIPGLKSLIDKSAELNVEHVLMGMAHRGRLNVLSTVVRKPLEQIFHEFSGMLELDSAIDGSGDVKYHLGMSHTRATHSGRGINITLLANPSHLEAVNPLVMGKARAKQFYRNSTNTIAGDDEASVLPLLIHGDASFAGQGVVYETMMMNDLPDYSNGGTVHLVINNQVGFTTDPWVARSTPYCTELGKAVGAPIFHVNGDDPEAVARVCEIAIEWRQKWRKDVIIDIVGYRKHGHNEIDEPSFTQPLLYQRIAKHPSVLQVYAKQLNDEGSITAVEVEQVSQRCMAILDASFNAAKDYKPDVNEWLQANWRQMFAGSTVSTPKTTGVPMDVVQNVGKALSNIPQGFEVHRRLRNHIRDQKAMFDTGEGFNWGAAENLAFGSLLLEGTHIRLSGQDVERGTFSHRHSVLHCQKTNDTYRPLNHISPKQAFYSVSNSHLSEYGVLGFELGYSMEHPNSLVLWEAQFGDFANTAQVIVDQFVSAQEDKWHRQTGLVMLLPHGYEGQGPEHSSARLERYLQMINERSDCFTDDSSLAVQKINMQVVNITTPANYFHALRRQIRRQFRKPLIVMSPKSLLRHPQARSRMDEMVGDTVFQPMYSDTSKTLTAKPKKVRRVIFCSGKVYYDIDQYREANDIHDVAVVRVEQLAPFPFHLVREQVKLYAKADIVWCQEEPMNQGAWAHVQPRLTTAADNNKTPRYVGRPPMSSTAAGSLVNHNNELKTFLEEAFAK